MTFPEVYLSPPSIALPAQRLSNQEVLQRLKHNFTGDAASWSKIERVVHRVFERCDSQYRYIEADPTRRVADFAADASRICLEENGVSASELDLLIYGGIAREYFEPATAMEVAAKLGVQQIHAFDVTSACVGQLEGVHIACAYMGLYPHINTALVCSAELTRGFLSYEIQSPAELAHKVAGLTIGNAAAAWMVRREPPARGGIRIQAMNNFSLPQHWHLCNAPIDGTFTSFSNELFKLNVHAPGELQRMLEKVGWAVEEVDHFVFHQPSEKMNDKVLTDLGADPERAIRTHHLYGNTASTTVALAMYELLRQRSVSAHDKLILSSAAAGFSMGTAAGTWCQ